MVHLATAVGGGQRAAAARKAQVNFRIARDQVQRGWRRQRLCRFSTN
jgi:hypothetical protein